MLTEWFPIHEPSALARLRRQWVQSCRSQPLDAVADYFGSALGFYFLFGSTFFCCCSRLCSFEPNAVRDRLLRFQYVSGCVSCVSK